MNILIDLVLLAIVCFSILYTTRKATVNALISIGLAVVSIVASWALTGPVSNLAVRWVEPPFAQTAAREIASMVGVPALDNGYDTMTAVTPEQIFDLGEDLEELSSRYGVTVDTLRNSCQGMAGTMASQTILTALVHPVSLAVTCAAVRLFLFLLIYWILKLVIKAIFGAKLGAKPPRKNLPVNLLLGIVMGVILSSYVFLPLLASVSPYQAGFLSLLNIGAACEKSVLFGIFAYANPFLNWMV